MRSTSAHHGSDVSESPFSRRSAQVFSRQASRLAVICLMAFSFSSRTAFSQSLRNPRISLMRSSGADGLFIFQLVSPIQERSRLFPQRLHPGCELCFFGVFEPDGQAGDQKGNRCIGFRFDLTIKFLADRQLPFRLKAPEAALGCLGAPLLAQLCTASVFRLGRPASVQ